MEHYLKSSIKGGAFFPPIVTDAWVNALRSGRYNDSNFVTGMATEDIILSQATNKFMSIIIKISDTIDDEDFSAADLVNDLSDVYHHAVELETNTALTLVDTQSTPVNGRYVQLTPTKGYVLKWAYCISTITPGPNTNADGAPIGQRIKLQVTTSLSDKDSWFLQSGKMFLKIIELGQGYDGIQIPRKDEVCPELLCSSFYSFISSALIGLDEGLLLPRAKNYLLPFMADNSRMSSLDNRTLFYKMLKNSWGKTKTDTVNSYSVISIPDADHSSFVLSAKVKTDYQPDIWQRNAGPVYTQSSTKINYLASGYKENDLLLQSDLLGFIDIKDIKMFNYKTTLFLKNQMPGMVETATNQLYEFYRFAFSGTSTTRQQVDNVKLSLVYNTLSLPFYDHCNEAADSGLNRGNVVVGDQDIYLPRFSLTYGYETSGALASQYDIYDATHNVYIKINV